LFIYTPPTAYYTLSLHDALPISDIFVLVDEGHRSQYGSFNIKMQKVFPNACFIAFTGTPLMKKEKSTANKFGGLIDVYSITDARSEEHTSELQSRENLVCRLLLE